MLITDTLADRLPYGAASEIQRRLAERKSARAKGHISMVLNGKREDDVVRTVALELIEEGWTRNYQRRGPRRRSKTKSK